MTYISTLGTNPRTVVTHSENESIDYSHYCAAKIPVGTAVKLLNTGYVAAVTALTDVVYGIVSVGNKEAGDKVTVKSQFVAIMVGEANGTVAVADFVATNGLNTAGELNKFKTAVATNYVTGIALTGNTTGLEVLVGILRNPYLKP